jgi:DNA-binding MarR family transcriptional regulator
MAPTPEFTANSAPSDSSDGLMDGLVQTSFAVMAMVNRVGAKHDLSPTQMRVLAILSDRQPKMAQLAHHLGLDKSSISGLIDRAEKRGLVQRDSTPEDGRAIRVSLTTAGRELAESIADQVRLSVAELTGSLSPSERRRLSALLAVLSPRFGE